MKHGKSGFVGAHGGSGFVAQLLAAGSTLLDGLVSYWALDEVSGVRYDSVGDNDLTDNNTVGYDTGVNGNAASFVAANAERLTIASPATGVSFAGQDFTISSWAKTTTNDTYILSNWGYGLYPNYGIAIIGGVPNFQYGAYRAEAGTATWGVSILDGNWHHVLCWCDESETKVYISMDGGTPVSAAIGAGMTVNDNPFTIGALDYINIFDGQIDEVAIWNRVLTEDERAELYAAGAGKFYPFEG